MPLAERGRLKQALLALSLAADDQAGYVEGAPLPIEHWGRTRPPRGGSGFAIPARSVAAFAAAGSR